MITYIKNFPFNSCDFCGEIIKDDGVPVDQEKHITLHSKCLGLMQNKENIREKIQEISPLLKSHNEPDYRQTADRINWLKFQLGETK